MNFSKEEIDSLKSIIDNADDKLLFKLFGKQFLTVKNIIKENVLADKQPYIFRNHFPDVN
jgi:hypothetical protein